MDKFVPNEVNYKIGVEEKYRADSNARLSKIVKKKISTTMIGALSSIEERFGFLWGDETDPSFMNDEQRQLYELYQLLRSDILDKGNNQSRNVDAEFSQYDIKWNRYKTEIPVIRKRDFGNIPQNDE